MNIKAVILVGGYGTRIGEETQIRPKPMVEIGGKPILWHIMKIYSTYGINDFILCLGYKGYKIKNFFKNYKINNSDITLNLIDGTQTVHKDQTEPWKITLVDTGLDTLTGSRIKKIQKYVNKDSFCLTYGDGVADINIKKLIQFHKEQKKYATLTAVQTAGRFGALKIKNDTVSSFEEKPTGDTGWVNGGFFILEPEIFNYIDDNQNVMWEKQPLQGLVKDQQLNSYKHNGFWHPMDTVGDKKNLDNLWKSGNPPWKVW